MCELLIIWKRNYAAPSQTKHENCSKFVSSGQVYLWRWRSGLRVSKFFVSYWKKKKPQSSRHRIYYHKIYLQVYEYQIYPIIISWQSSRCSPWAYAICFYKADLLSGGKSPSPFVSFWIQERWRCAFRSQGQQK